MRATSGFTVDACEPAPFDEDTEAPEGVHLSRTRIAKTFWGDIAATSVTQAVTAVTQEASAGSVAIELLVGACVRKGSFLLMLVQSGPQAPPCSTHALGRSMAWRAFRHPDRQEDERDNSA